MLNEFERKPSYLSPKREKAAKAEITTDIGTAPIEVFYDCQRGKRRSKVKQFKQEQQ